ncbi:MAG: ATP-binding protein [Dehalococcoidia bacterium]
MTPLVAPGLDALDDRVALTAALSTHFDPLGVLGAELLLKDDRVELIDGLAAVCDEVEVAGSDHRHWSMRTEARQRVLQTMAARPGFTTLLDSIDVPAGDLFATYLRDGLRGEDLSALIPAEGDPPAQRVDTDLDSLLRAVRFLDDLPVGRTEAGDLDRRVRRQIALTDAASTLQAVAPKRLIGREDDYEALLDYGRTVLATDRDWVPSFVLVGPGGVGKSALVSTFVLDQRRAALAPLVYLDFDRATLIEATPLDLTQEFARQLGLADVSLDQPLTEFRERSRSLLAGQENLNIDVGGGASSAALRDLGSLLSGWPLRTAPVTIVLDTFEELAARGITAVRDVLVWVADVRDKAQLPQVHLIVCGRAVVPDAPTLAPDDVRAMFNMQLEREWPLEDLAPGEAIDLLTELGVEPGLASRFPPVFGGNPLVLKLIHRFVTTNDPDEIDRLVADCEEARGDAPAGEVGLRFVYERILNRIRNPEVKALAYPGVVLRRVTPELILEVLAPACRDRLEVSTLADAEEVFDELAGHVWLVNRIAPDAVVHRADLRRLLVPGLEQSTDVDTEAIHRAAVAYYAARPDSVAPAIAEIEEVYHRGLLDNLPDDMPQEQAENVVRGLAVDIEYWPLRARALVKSRAGNHDQLTEDEVMSLGAAQQRRTRGARLEKQLASSDVDSAEFEDAQLELLDDEEGDAGAAIPDSRWRLLFYRGDFEFMTEASRVLSAFDRYFVADRPRTFSGTWTHEYPWYIVSAVLMVERGARPLFSQDALAALESGWEEDRRYGAALAALAGDRDGHARIVELVRREIRPRVELSTVDDIIVCQAAASRGDLDDRPMAFQTFSFDHFRLPHIVAIATAAGDNAVADRVTKATERYVVQRPDTMELNRLRQTLASAYVNLGGAQQLRASPTTLSFLYGLIRTVIGSLDRDALLAVVGELHQRSVFWPSDLTADALAPTFGATMTPADQTGLIETADRCGLIVDLIDFASAKANSRLSRQLRAGIRRIEGLLFPSAGPRAEPPARG